MRFFAAFSSLVLSLGAVLVQGQGTNGQNAITFPLGGTVDGAAPIQITWTPSTSGTVSIVLLKGPPGNILDVETIAPKVANSGVFTWNVPTTLEDKASMQDGRRYAFKIIDDLTNTFEYSPPFEMSVPGSTFVVSSSSAAESSTTSTTSTSTSSSSSTTSETSTTTTEEATSTTEEPTSTPTESETETESPTEPTETTTEAPTAAPSKPSTGLAKPAIIAIVVIVLVAVAAVVIGAVLCMKRRKRASNRGSIIGDSLGPAHHARGDSIAMHKTVGGTPYGKQAPIYSGSTATLTNPFEEPKSAYHVNNTSVASLQNPFAEPVTRTRSREADYGYANSTPGYARSTNDNYTSDGYNPYGNKF